MYQLTNITEIKKLMKKHQVEFKKGLGQNFIIDPHVCPKMVDLSGIDESYVAIEIGTGVGVLTKELAKRASKVIAIEIDERLFPLLEESLSEFKNIKILHQDALKVDFSQLIEAEAQGKKVCICANLPYYITSPILMHLLESKLNIEFITAMVQREAANRLVSPVGTRESGAITVGVHYHSNPKVLFRVSRGCFMPSPNVDSSVIYLKVRKEYDLTPKEETLYFSIVKACFMKRRKTILNAISTGLPIEKETLKTILKTCDLKETLRGEELTLEDYSRLVKEMLKLEKDRVG